MSTSASTSTNRPVRLLGTITLILGIIFVVAGGTAWGIVSTKLASEEITVSEDARFFGGKKVRDPFTAYAQADIINKHALSASDGKTYAELEKDDPRRETVMNGSFLRASLFTSVVAFGVSALVIGVGVVFGLIGFALRKLGSE